MGTSASLLESYIDLANAETGELGRRCRAVFDMVIEMRGAGAERRLTAPEPVQYEFSSTEDGRIIIALTQGDLRYISFMSFMRNLGASRNAHKIRRCAHTECGQFFVARNDQKFCRGLCRQRQWRITNSGAYREYQNKRDDQRKKERRDQKIAREQEDVVRCEQRATGRGRVAPGSSG